MWPFATRGSRFLGEAADRHPSRLNPEDFARYPASLITVGLARGLHFFDRRLPWNEGCEGQPP